MPAGSNKVQIIIEAKDATGAVFREIQGEVKSFSTSTASEFERVRRSAMSIKTALGGIVSAAVLWKIKAMADEWVRLAGVQEQAEAGVRQAMISMGRYSRESFEGIKRLASELQRMSTFGDEAILSGTKFLLTYKQIPDKLLPRTMKAMVDLAALMGGDMRSAANMLGKASMGLTGELRRAGITVDQATYKSQGFVGVLKQIEEQVRGQAQAMAQTKYGQLQQFSNVVLDTGEKLGDLVAEFKRSFIPALKAANSWVASIVKNMQKMREEGKDSFGFQLRSQISSVESQIRALERLKSYAEGRGGLAGSMFRALGGVPKSAKQYSDEIDVLKIKLKLLREELKEYKDANSSFHQDFLALQKELHKEAAQTAAPADLTDYYKQQMKDWEQVTKDFYAAERAQAERNAREYIDMRKRMRDEDLQNLQEAMQEETQYIEGGSEQIRSLYEQLFGKEFANEIFGVADEVKQSFDLMTEVAKETARNMQQAFTDFFFDAMQGKLKNLGDYISSFLTAIQRSLAGGLSQILIGSLTDWNLQPNILPGGGLFFHGGGVVGETPVPVKMVNPAIFANAPKLHSGLAPDEFPAILQRGETVLPKGAGGGDTYILISAVDSQSFADAVRRNRAVVVGASIEDIKRNGPLRQIIGDTL